MKWSVFFQFVWLVLLSLGQAQSAMASDNILVIVVDDLGVDKIGAYRDGECIDGQCPSPPETLALDSLASAGLLFRNAWAAPVCTPTRVGMMTGRHSRRMGIGSALHTTRRDELGLDPGAPNLANTLKAAGYSTAAIGKWHMAGCPNVADVCTGTAVEFEAHPILSGFDYFAGSRNNPVDYCTWNKTISERTGPGPDDYTTQTVQTNKYMTVDTADEAISHIPTMPEPWFVWLAFNASHTPLHDVPSEADGCVSEQLSTRVEMHTDMTEKMDREISRLLDTINASTFFLNRTTIIALGDNGTHGTVTEPPFIREHGKSSAYEGGVNVPFIISGPSVAPAARGREVSGLIHSVDVFSTVMELAGLTPCPGGTGCGEDSVSLVPYFADPSQPSIRDEVYTEAFWPNAFTYPTSSRQAVRGDRYKVIRDYVDDIATVEFYDLESDPLELDNLLTRPLDTAETTALATLGSKLEAMTGHCIAPDDSDADCVPDAIDNCVNTPNGPLEADEPGRGNQLDGEGDGIGTICDLNDDLDPDEDDDGLPDWVESNSHVFLDEGDTGTDPNNRDTDGDLVSDGSEVLDGADPLSAKSIPTTFADPVPFDAYTSERIERINFDSFPGGTVLSGASLTDIGGAEIPVILPTGVPDVLHPTGVVADLAVVDGTDWFPTTSGSNALGSTHFHSANHFVAGSTFDFAFGAPIGGIAMHIIVREGGSSVLQTEALQLEAPGAQTAKLRDFERVHLGSFDGAEYYAYFLATHSTESFTTATLRAGPAVTPGDFTFLIDDITTVPEPEPMWVLAPMAFALIIASRRRRSLRRHPRTH